MNNDIRAQFPALERRAGGQKVVYLDGPAGTQVPLSVMEAITNYYSHRNANTHGYFATSQETDELLQRTRSKAATFLGAPSADCISFGANMTTLNYSLSRGLGRLFTSGDEIIVTQLDHESNRGPWLALEREGMVIKEIPLLPDGRLDYSILPNLITSKTKLVAMGLASNIFGTVNDVARVKSHLPEGTLLLVDAVHYAPHFSIDVTELDCDFLLCSAYKYYGPHVGILYARPGLLDTIPLDRLRTQEQKAPYLIETGTLNHAALAGVEASLNFVASCADDVGSTDLRSKFISAFRNIGQHEGKLIRALAQRLQEMVGIKIWGPPFGADQRAPTISFTSDTLTAAELCQALGERGINAWDGHFYAIRATEVLGLLQGGGVTRMGMSIYNTMKEVERTADAVQEIVHSAR